VKRLIVNADDFGRSPGVNTGVLDAHTRGIVTSATVLVLENSAARGIREAAERGRGLSLGLHFALTGGGPPAAPARDVLHVAPGGRFPRHREELPDRLPEAEVAAELEAQIGIFECLARKPPSHLDSHHHVALHPSVGPAFAAVAKKRSLPARAASEEARRSLRAAGVKTPDRFVDTFYGPGVARDVLERILEELPEGTTEVMCHPGRADDALRAASSYVDEREWEVDILCDPAIRALLRSRKIELIGFDRL
jgi:predicted glycoside hydrolase/deacetylase ChbG (UPF0249 family)